MRSLALTFLILLAATRSTPSAGGVFIGNPPGIVRIRPLPPRIHARHEGGVVLDACASPSPRPVAQPPLLRREYARRDRSVRCAKSP